MANTLTALLPTLFKVLNNVLREQVGFIPAVSQDFSPKEMDLAVDQTMTIPLSVTQALGTYTPAMTTTAGTDKTPESTTLTIANNKSTSFNLTHEERQLLLNGGTLAGFREQQIAQGIRAFVNQIESDIWTAMDIKFARAYGTAATTPFATNLAAIANMKKMAKDAGAWAPGQMRLVVDTAAELNLSSLTQLTNVNQAGTDDLLRRGVITSLGGFEIGVSAGVGVHTAGSNSGGRTGAAGYAIGIKSLVLDSYGTGTILPGDVLAITGDASAQKYGVITGDTDVSNGGTIVLAAPGLRGTLSAATHTLTTTADHTSNFAFNRNGVLLFARPPRIDKTPILDTAVITDPVSGLSLMACEILGDGMTTFRLNLAWGVSIIRPDYVFKLIG